MKMQKNKKGFFYARFIKDEYKEYFIENLSMLMGSGLTLPGSLSAIKAELNSKKIKKIINDLQVNIDAGVKFWKALEETNLFSAQVISLIRIGEESGTMVENLKIIAIQEQKEKSFRSKINTAMLYPVFIFSLTIIVGVGIIWFIIPRITKVFNSIDAELPFITKWFIKMGKFIIASGNIVLPLLVFFLMLVTYFVFFFHKTKFIGQFLLFHTPGINKLIKQVELARFGSVLGTLINSGFSVVDAFESLSKSSNFYAYNNLYTYLKKNIEEGNSFKTSFLTYKKINKLIPHTIQQMIIVGEKSGALSNTFTKIGNIFDEKTENTAKTITILIEPILLVIVWLMVMMVAIAVIYPIYSMIGSIN